MKNDRIGLFQRHLFAWQNILAEYNSAWENPSSTPREDIVSNFVKDWPQIDNAQQQAARDMPIMAACLAMTGVAVLRDLVSAEQRLAWWKAALEATNKLPIGRFPVHYDLSDGKTFVRNDILRNYGTALQEAGRYEEAEKVFREALQTTARWDEKLNYKA